MIASHTRPDREREDRGDTFPYNASSSEKELCLEIMIRNVRTTFVQ